MGKGHDLGLYAISGKRDVIQEICVLLVYY